MSAQVHVLYPGAARALENAGQDPALLRSEVGYTLSIIRDLQYQHLGDMTPATVRDIAWIVARRFDLGIPFDLPVGGEVRSAPFDRLLRRLHIASLISPTGAGGGFVLTRAGETHLETAFADRIEEPRWRAAIENTLEELYGFDPHEIVADLLDSGRAWRP